MGAPRLSDADIERAVQILDGWSGKLTWDRYLAVLATELGHLYTKPAMHKQARIIGAWEGAHKRLAEGKDAVGASEAGDAAIAHAYRKVARLQAEVDRLKQENRDLLERFSRWSLNAARAGLSPEQLDAPIVSFGRRK
ncbi:MAG: hypothetical protein PW843_28445 [Azospirillaceae bacterium]|nr:hypothetical protein [Azospirillaceae bacterium]